MWLLMENMDSIIHQDSIAEGGHNSSPATRPDITDGKCVMKIYEESGKPCRNRVSADQLNQMSLPEILTLKNQLVDSIQEVSQSLGKLLQERHYLQEEVSGRHVTIAQLLRVQEARASELGLQPAVQMSAVVRR